MERCWGIHKRSSWVEDWEEDIKAQASVKSLIEARTWASEMVGFGGEVLCGKRGSIRALTEMFEPSGGV